MENIGDVTKQYDLSRFYRYRYEQYIENKKKDKECKDKEDGNEPISNIFKEAEETEQTYQNKTINEISIAVKTRNSRHYR